MVCDKNTQKEIRRFFEGAKKDLDHLREARLTKLRQETPRFFEGARQGLDTLRPAVIQLDRHLARKFNFFQAIAFFESLKAEDRMSCVFAYLLNPDQTHGQQDLFLTAFLSHLRENEKTQSPVKRILPDGSTDWSDVRVSREAPTTHIEAFKWIDIEINMLVDGTRVGIAIENKPWAEDQDKQLTDYAEHLQKKYDGRFNLIYLTPTGEEDPSEHSINREKREKLKGEKKLANASIHDWASDKGWLKRAEDEVKAERVRWFVSDFRKALAEEFPAQKEDPDLKM